MSWSAANLWWLVAGGLVLAELATGTFYLLMLALGAASGALAALAGTGLTAQLLTAALVGGGAVVAWHRRRLCRARRAPELASNRDVNLDVGESVHVAHWDAEGRTLVAYRGSNWQAVYRGAGTPAPGRHLIVAIESNHLVLAPLDA